MLFFIQYKDKEYPIRIETRKEKTYVKIGDFPEEEIDLSFFGNDCSYVSKSLVFQGNVTSQKENYTVWRPSGNIELKVESEYRRIVGMLRGQQLFDENHVYSKMPGKIVKVLAKIGDIVDKSTPLMVMEAMKMENEIRSQKKAEIVSIRVTEAQAVETGTLLMELKLIEE